MVIASSVHSASVTRRHPISSTTIPRNDASINLGLSRLRTYSSQHISAPVRAWASAHQSERIARLAFGPAGDASVIVLTKGCEHHTPPDVIAILLQRTF
ncbi:hypothetical protein Poly51_59260 [Rubripirellula tenax]|uniref:Uncharacterized protein n=1 Tax=Rubripirellula tenax TaxID=2528015 RepID=A0A5C6E9Q1_9BACT|nr:hypothetical protein [Rubripirellula tenax]TWU44657.1 hypothetical protein Poly51_59260 [Rubripirellula tenax]